MYTVIAVTVCFLKAFCYVQDLLLLGSSSRWAPSGERLHILWIFDCGFYSFFLGCFLPMVGVSGFAFAVCFVYSGNEI